MPREVGYFKRVNSEFDGSEVWQDDLATNVKIIAYRHDFHDQDLADGIFECLPKSGNEPMAGSLTMGGFKILNQAQGTVESDGANFGQTVNSMSFNEGTRTLTLERLGLADLGVTIQSGGDNTIITTGVQKITVGSGLNLDSVGGGNVLEEGNEEGTISLGDINGVAGSYSNPNITIDSKGRVSSVTSGSSSGSVSNLGTNYGSTSVTITNSGGTSTSIGSAGARTPISAGTAGVQNSTDKAKIDSFPYEADAGSYVVPELKLTKGASSTTITDHRGLQTSLTMWANAGNAGLAAGYVTSSAPSSASGYPDGFVWYVY